MFHPSQSLAKIFAFIFLTGFARAETLPAAPQHYFNDYAHVVSAPVAQQLNSQLEQFERDTSNQIRVVIFPKMQSDDSVQSYTLRLAQAWGIGQKEVSNGAVLFVFVQDHQMFLQVGYGLEGALTDALCKDIISDQIAPRFKAGDYDGGVRAGVNSILAATRGEYKGTGRTNAETRGAANGGPWWLNFIVNHFFLVFILLVLLLHLRRRRGSTYNSRGASHPFLRGMFTGWYLSGGGGGGGWSSGGAVDFPAEAAADFRRAVEVDSAAAAAGGSW